MRTTQRLWFTGVLAASALLASAVSAQGVCYGKTALCQRQAMQAETAQTARAEALPERGAKGVTPSKTAVEMLQASKPEPRHEGVDPKPAAERCTSKTSVCQRQR